MVNEAFSLMISKAVGEVAKIPIDIIKNKALRNDTILIILKKLDIDPQTIPTDFEGIYIFTLIDFGFDKPAPFLDLFKNEYIKKAFRQGFASRDMTGLERECQDFLENDSN